MAHMLVRHHVADFSRWKAAYDDDRPRRQASGLHDLHLWRSLDDPSEVVLVFATDDVVKAREFATSAALKETMQDAGVQGRPDVAFLSEA